MSHKTKEELTESLAQHGIEFGDAAVIGMLEFLRSRRDMGEDLSDAWIRGFNAAYLLRDINERQFAPDYFQDVPAFQDLLDEWFLSIKVFVDIVLKEGG